MIAMANVHCYGDDNGGHHMSKLTTTDNEDCDTDFDVRTRKLRVLRPGCRW